MRKIFWILLLISISVIADEKPIATYSASGSVTDLIYTENKLYASTNAGSVDIFDTQSKELLKQIKVPKTPDFMGELMSSKVYSLDLLDSKVLLLSQGKKGARQVHIYEYETLTLVLPDTKKLFIAKAKFLDNENILLALLSNEIISYNIISQKINYQIQVSQSKFSNFVLNEDKSQIIIADESGELKIHNTSNGKLLRILSGKNLDNVFDVDTKNGIIATAGQDRRLVVYMNNIDATYYKTSHFLIYSVGLSPSGAIVAYSSDENNNITLFDTRTQKTIGIYGGNKMTPTKILFIDENNFFVSSDDKVINQFKIK